MGGREGGGRKRGGESEREGERGREGVREREEEREGRGREMIVLLCWVSSLGIMRERDKGRSRRRMGQR